MSRTKTRAGSGRVYHLTKDAQQMLREKLDEIPPLCEDLAITEVRLDRTVRNEQRQRASADSSREPYNHSARKASDALNAELLRWVTVTHQCSPATPPTSQSTITLARWLQHNVLFLAVIPGAEKSWPDINAAVRRARAVTDLPPEDDVIATPDRVKDARFQILTARQVELAAQRMGPLAKGLNRRRMKTLENRGLIEPLHVDATDGTKFYRVGDVLDAHADHPRRVRDRSAGSAG